MLFKIYKEGLLAVKTVSFYFHTIIAFSFIISLGGEIGKKAGGW